MEFYGTVDPKDGTLGGINRLYMYIFLKPNTRKKNLNINMGLKPKTVLEETSH